jgi:N-acyl-D-amino-acid deacylase
MRSVSKLALLLSATLCELRSKTLYALVAAVALACGGDATAPTLDGRLFVTIVPHSLFLVGAGDTCQLSATVRNADGEDITGKTTLWQSSDPDVASIDLTGTVTAISPGRFTVTVTVDSVTANRDGSVVGATGVGIRSIDQSVASFMDRYDIPGLAIAVMKDGRLVVARGYGYADVQNDEGVEPDALFRIASLSKPITAVAVLKLREEGRVALNDRAFDILADLWPADSAEVADAPLRDITVRMLLQHSGGWDPDIAFDPMFESYSIAAEMGVEAPADAETIIRYMIRQPLQFAPGTRYAYSNFGYCVLGRVIERITGSDYEDYVQQNILAPVAISRMQIGDNSLSGRVPGEVVYYGSDAPYGENTLEAMDSHGGWIASTTDLVRFLASVDGSETTPELLDSGSRNDMGARDSSLWPGSGWYYALGWARYENQWSHAGSLPGTSAHMEM